MNELVWLFMANAAVWLGLGGYLFRLHRAQSSLVKRLDRLASQCDTNRYPTGP